MTKHVQENFVDQTTRTLEAIENPQRAEELYGMLLENLPKLENITLDSKSWKDLGSAILLFHPPFTKLPSKLLSFVTEKALVDGPDQEYSDTLMKSVPTFKMTHMSYESQQALVELLGTKNLNPSFEQLTSLYQTEKTYFPFIRDIYIMAADSANVTSEKLLKFYEEGLNSKNNSQHQSLNIISNIIDLAIKDENIKPDAMNVFKKYLEKELKINHSHTWASNNEIIRSIMRLNKKMGLDPSEKHNPEIYTLIFKLQKRDLERKEGKFRRDAIKELATLNKFYPHLKEEMVELLLNHASTEKNVENMTALREVLGPQKLNATTLQFKQVLDDQFKHLRFSFKESYPIVNWSKESLQHLVNFAVSYPDYRQEAIKEMMDKATRYAKSSSSLLDEIEKALLTKGLNATEAEKNTPYQAKVDRLVEDLKDDKTNSQEWRKGVVRTLADLAKKRPYFRENVIRAFEEQLAQEKNAGPIVEELNKSLEEVKHAPEKENTENRAVQNMGALLSQLIKTGASTPANDVSNKAQDRAKQI